MSNFFRKQELILSEVFLFMERSKNHGKILFHNRAKKIQLPEMV